MTELTSTKPYMVRAIHEWCVDNACTPHLLVAVNSQTRVPMAYVKEGEIVLNLNYTATKDLHIDNEVITFSARFGGISQNLYVPMSAVKGIFARETGQGMFFEVEPLLPVASLKDDDVSESKVESTQSKPVNNKKPTLTIVK
ncbi:MAG: ClpXP protease specificity-enhancing factor [Sulfuritalea sp.]|jgi:stringent starvation protein B|nr:ClpXP protease specificity-enhancing factor [Sulfuritalea sp.]